MKREKTRSARVASKTASVQWFINRRTYLVESRASCETETSNQSYTLTISLYLYACTNLVLK